MNATKWVTPKEINVFIKKCFRNSIIAGNSSCFFFTSIYYFLMRVLTRTNLFLYIRNIFSRVYNIFLNAFDKQAIYPCTAFTCINHILHTSEHTATHTLNILTRIPVVSYSIFLHSNTFLRAHRIFLPIDYQHILYNPDTNAALKSTWLF